MTRHLFARIWAVLLLAAFAPSIVSAAPFAAYVMDARTGKPLYAQNAQSRLHPASLTKMMTLYIAFASIERGQVRLDSKFTISSNAAAEPPSKLGLRAGQQIELRYLIRAAAIKSANDAATAIGEGLAGSEAAFAQQMTATARALGMRNTNFRNANGLTQEGHYSSAEDMTILGRRLFYDFPQYYSLFSRRSADAGVAQVASTNRRFLDAYQGADGIKTGYTRAAGFSLTASAQRGNKRIIATVLGGTSTAQRNQVMGQLLDAGFGNAPSRVREVRPEPVQLLAQQKVVRKAQVEPSPAATAPQPQVLALTRSQLPRRASAAASTTAVSAPARAVETPAPPQAAPAVGGMQLASSRRPQERPGSAAQTATVADTGGQAGADAPPATQSASIAGSVIASARPAPAPRSRGSAVPAATRQVAAVATPEVEEEGSASEDVTAGDLSLSASNAPKRRSETVILAAMGEGDFGDPDPIETVSRSSASARNWGVTLGLFRSQAEAERLLLQTALQDGVALGNARRHVANTNRGFEPQFAGLTKSAAQRVCDRLNAMQGGCRIIGP